MTKKDSGAFPLGVAERLKTYVYRLIDPRNGETFYVGKGQGDRVFAHIHDEINDEDPNNRLRRIREIRLAGFDVAHVIHRHGMDNKTAFEVESALLDAYPGLTNVAGGTGSSDFGAMHAQEIINRYAAIAADFQHRALLISVNWSATESSLYESTRFAWKISLANAKKADVILATFHGIIVGAFIADEWVDATTDNFPGRETMPGRLGFIG